jgi:hypothetical protein
MRKKKFYFNEAEWRCILHSLNAYRTKLLNEGTYTDVIDETIVKIVKAPIRKVKVS